MNQAIELKVNDKPVWSTPQLSILSLNKTFGVCTDSVAKPNSSSADGTDAFCS